MLDIVCKISPITYTLNYRNDIKDIPNKLKKIGFSAQQLLSILKFISQKDYTHIVDESNPYRYHVSFANIIPLLVQSIAECIHKIEKIKDIVTNINL